MELLSSSTTALLIKNYEWTASPLGDPATWPATLHTAIRVCLAATRPMQLWWGPELVVIPNDACAKLRTDPILGKRASEVWQASWATLGPALDATLRGEVATAAGMTFTPLHGGVLVCHEEQHFLGALGHALEAPLSAIPNRKAEHAPQMLDALVTELLVGMKDRFRIGFGGERVSGR